MASDESDVPFSDVSMTAIGIAEVRARESDRADRLFYDPYAAPFVSASKSRLPSEGALRDFVALLNSAGDYVSIKTRFFDGHLLDLARAGCRQFVLVAAGLDSRAFRLAWPDGSHLFELDTPGLFGFKESVLSKEKAEPRCRRTVIPADLKSGDWISRLGREGFRRDEPSVWLIEGLLVYLTQEESDDLLSGVERLAAPGSRLVLEYTGRASVASGTMESALSHLDRGASARIATMFKKGTPELEPLEWLSGRGWRAQRFDLHDLARTYDRRLSSIFGEGDGNSARRGLISATWP